MSYNVEELQERFTELFILALSRIEFLNVGIRKKKSPASVALQIFLTSTLEKPEPHKMIKHTQTISRQQPTNFLSVFDHFVGLELEGLKSLSKA